MADITEIQVKHAKSLDAELDSGIQLPPGETYIFKALGLVKNSIGGTTAFLIAATEQRLLLLSNKAFGSDSLVSVPYGAVTSVAFKEGGLFSTGSSTEIAYGGKKTSFMLLERCAGFVGTLKLITTQVTNRSYNNDPILIGELFDIVKPRLPAGVLNEASFQKILEKRDKLIGKA